VIVKFRDATIDPMRADFVEHLSHDAGVPLVYLRPISGGAHVFGVEGVSDPGQLAEVMRRLAERGDVAYVEENRPWRHQ
jgi:hypothetical protein